MALASKASKLLIEASWVRIPVSPPCACSSMVEQGTHNPLVLSSNLGGRTKWERGGTAYTADSKSAVARHEGSNPSASTKWNSSSVEEQRLLTVRPRFDSERSCNYSCSLMDKASDSYSEDCEFESHHEYQIYKGAS